MFFCLSVKIQDQMEEEFQEDNLNLDDDDNQQHNTIFNKICNDLSIEENLERKSLVFSKIFFLFI